MEESQDALIAVVSVQLMGGESSQFGMIGSVPRTGTSCGTFAEVPAL